MKKKCNGKGRLTIKIPREELHGENTYEKVRNHLENNPDYAYTRGGLMVEIYSFNEEDLNVPFGSWPKGASTQYTRIRRALARLEDEGLIESKREGKRFLYWWKA